jgi:hypothetical protein
MKTKTKKSEIVFHAKALVARVANFAAGKELVRERAANLPPSQGK